MRRNGSLASVRGTGLRLGAALCVAVVAALPVSPAACRGEDVVRVEGATAVPVQRPEEPPLRFAVSAMLSPAPTWDAYADLLRGMAEELGLDHRFLQRRTYAEVNDLLLAGEVDLAFICSGAYAALPADAPIDLLAVPVHDGRSVYNSVVIVRSDSPYETFDDLRGAHFAFTDPLSNTGCLYPRYRLHQSGETPERFFASTTFTGSHDRSVLAVFRKAVDAAAVDAVIYEQVVTAGSLYDGRLRVIERSPDFPNPPVVAPNRVPAERRAAMRRFLFSLAESDGGRRLLARVGMDSFAPATVEDFRPIRAMIEAVGPAHEPALPR